MPEIKNIKKAALRIKKAIKSKENIVIYSDADLDGTAALILLEESINNLGGKASCCYFPDREKEGYGLNQGALNFLKKYAPGLLIVLDCGASNHQELKLAHDCGLSVIVIDHHEITEKLPHDILLVNPKQEDDPYPFKKLATVGLVYKISEQLLKKQPSPALAQSFLELVAIATLADMMPEESDNKLFIEQGLKTILTTFRPGLKVLLKMVAGREDLPREAAQKLIPILNISEVREHLTATYRLLTSQSADKAEALTQDLYLKSQERKKAIKEIIEEVEHRVADKGEVGDFIFEVSADWPQMLTGTVASRVCNRYKKPAFILKINQQTTRGSVRAPKEVDSVQALKSCSSLLEMYGGHPPASGFAVKNENIDKLRECLARYFS